MSDVQVLLSVLLSFLFPGLPQLYQSQTFPERAKPAFVLVLCSLLCVYSLIGLAVVWILWIVSAVEWVMWHVRGPQQPPLRTLLVLLALGAASASAMASEPSGEFSDQRLIQSLETSPPSPWDSVDPSTVPLPWPNDRPLVKPQPQSRPVTKPCPDGGPCPNKPRTVNRCPNCSPRKITTYTYRRPILRRRFR